jgi:thiol-disulfide isomerase/thioredoxin
MKRSSGELRTTLLACVLAGVAARADTTGQTMAEAAGRGLVGVPAPRVIVETIDGESIDLGALYGKKAVYLKFWATWCVPCREQMPHFEHVYENAGPDLAVIAINAGFNDSVEEIRKYRGQTGITMPIVFDGDGQLGQAFNLRVTPQHVVIGRDGRIRYVGHYADQKLDAALLAARVPAAQDVAAGEARIVVAGPRYAVGDTLPETVVQTLDGQSYPLRSAGGRKATVLVFLSPWCESYLATTRPSVSANCRAGREQVATLAHDQRIRWLGVASGLWATPQDLRDYRTKYKPGIPLTLDESGALFREFRVTNTPTVLVADAYGRIARRIESGDRESLPEAIGAVR